MLLLGRGDRLATIVLADRLFIAVLVSRKGISSCDESRSRRLARRATFLAELRGLAGFEGAAAALHHGLAVGLEVEAAISVMADVLGSLAEPDIFSSVDIEDTGMLPRSSLRRLLQLRHSNVRLSPLDGLNFTDLHFVQLELSPKLVPVRVSTWSLLLNRSFAALLSNCFSSFEASGYDVAFRDFSQKLYLLMLKELSREHMLMRLISRTHEVQT